MSHLTPPPPLLGSTLPRPRLAVRAAWLVGLGLVGPLVGGCQCEDEKPYTPFSVASGTTSETKPPPAPTPAVDSNVVVAQEPGLTRWTVLSSTLSAAPGASFLSAARVGARLFSWQVGRDEVDGLWLHDESGASAKRVVPAPDFLPSGNDCEESATLLLGPAETATLDVARKCAVRQLSGSASRAFLLLDLAREEPRLFGLRLGDDPEGERLDVTASAADLDGDGQGDTDLAFEVSTAKGQKAKLSLHFLTRPAGPSRQKDTPSCEFTTAAKALVISGQRKAERASVPGQVEAWRRLYGALCAESLSARVHAWDGAALPCTSMDDGLGNLVLAAVHAHLGNKAPARALGEWERASWYGVSVPSALTKKLLSDAILARLPHGAVRKRAELPLALPAPNGNLPERRLAFDQASRLWAQLTPTQFVEVWPSTASAHGGAPGHDAAPNPVGERAPAERKLMAVLPSCDRAEVQLATSDGAGKMTEPLLLDLLAPRPGRCKAFGGGPLPAWISEWKSGVATLSTAGQVFRSDGGAPADPSVVTGLGYLDVRGERVELWQGAALRADLECATSPDHEYLACAQAGRVTIWQRPETTATATP